MPCSIDWHTNFQFQPNVTDEQIEWDRKWQAWAIRLLDEGVVDMQSVALKLASDEVKRDRERVLAATKIDGADALYAASAELWYDPLLMSWAALSRGARLWRRFREAVKGKRAMWLWLEDTAKTTELRRIQRAELGHVWEEEGGSPLT